MAFFSLFVVLYCAVTAVLCSPVVLQDCEVRCFVVLSVFCCCIALCCVALCCIVLHYIALSSAILRFIHAFGYLGAKKHDLINARNDDD